MSDEEDLFEDVFRGFPAPWRGGRRPILETRGWAPAVDMYEQDNEIVVKTGLPGMEKEDIHVGVTECSSCWTATSIPSIYS
jgi:HSP20 family molecular chaperone IbpA